MAVHALAFLESPGADGWKPVYFIGPGKAGPRAKAATYEPLLAERAVDAIVNGTLDPESRDMALATFYADETDARSVSSEAQTLPFLTERRVVVVRNAEQYQAATTGGALHTYLDNPNETTVMVLLSNAVDKRTKLYKACEKHGVIVECPALSTREAQDWLRKEAKLRGRTIDGAAATELLSRSGAHLSDVDNALTLVINFLGEDTGPITEDAVRQACADVAEEEIWSLTDAIAKSDMAAALTALRKLLDLGKHPDEVIGTINWLLKNAYRVAVSAGDPGISRFVAEKVQPLARKLGVNKLRDAFALCTDTQFALRETGSNPTLAVELLVIKLSAPRTSAA